MLLGQILLVGLAPMPVARVLPRLCGPHSRLPLWGPPFLRRCPSIRLLRPTRPVPSCMSMRRWGAPPSILASWRVPVIRVMAGLSCWRDRGAGQGLEWRNGALPVPHWRMQLLASITCACSCSVAASETASSSACLLLGGAREVRARKSHHNMWGRNTRRRALLETLGS